jgi:RNA polymerase sigma-32 factor
VKQSDVIEMEQRLQGGDVALEPSPSDGDEIVTPIAYLTDASEGPAEAFEREQGDKLRSEGLASALQGLDDRSRRIIQARWLAEKDPLTLHELADEFGVSAERIRQIEVKAMQKMKKQLAQLNG